MKLQIETSLFVAFVGLFTTVVESAEWVNAYDGPFTFACPQLQYISYIGSIHDNSKEDRIWEFRCSTLNVDPEYFNTETCFWSEYVNDFDQPVVHQCPDKHFLAGLSSYHDNHYEDRRWKFYCCDIQGHHLEDCNYSGYVNSLDNPMTYSVPAGKILKGAVSINNNDAEDRVWEFEECSLVEY